MPGQGSPLLMTCALVCHSWGHHAIHDKTWNCDLELNLVLLTLQTLSSGFGYGDGPDCADVRRGFGSYLSGDPNLGFISFSPPKVSIPRSPSSYNYHLYLHTHLPTFLELAVILDYYITLYHI